MPSTPLSPSPASPRGLKMLFLISSVFLVLLVHLHLFASPSSSAAFGNNHHSRQHQQRGLALLPDKHSPSPAEEDDVQFVDLTPPKDGLDPQLGTDGADDVEIKTLFGSCREERLESLAQLLPGFQPSLDVTTWLWGSLEQLKGRKLPFGTQNVQDKIAQLASERSESSNLLWSPIKTNEGNGNCDPHQASKKCVVVGNSYALLHSNLGRTIDAHDVVMRFNTAPATPKYALDVGRKTTARFFYPESAELVAKEAALAYSSSRARGQKKGPSPLSDYYMMTFYKPDDVEWLLLADSQKSEGEKTNAFSKLRFWKDVPAPGEVAALADHVRIMNPELLFETKSLANLDGIPTSGLYAIVLALHECSLPVSIAGFAYTINPKDPMHYYDRKLMGDILDPKNAGKHGVGTERAFIDKLIKMGVVRDLMKK